MLIILIYNYLDFNLRNIIYYLKKYKLCEKKLLYNDNSMNYLRYYLHLSIVRNISKFKIQLCKN